MRSLVERKKMKAKTQNWAKDLFEGLGIGSISEIDIDRHHNGINSVANSAHPLGMEVIGTAVVAARKNGGYHTVNLRSEKGEHVEDYKALIKGQGSKILSKMYGHYGHQLVLTSKEIKVVKNQPSSKKLNPV